MSIHKRPHCETPSPRTGREPTLFSPYRLGDLELSNRLVMSPMTRSRALDGNVPNPLAATYYAQRASAGLIVTEATQVSPQGVGYIRTPGIHSAEQVAGWKTVTDAVHRAGGKIFAQLWHVGTRVASGFSRRRAAGRSIRAAGGRRSLHHARPDQVGDAARARDRRDSRHRRAIPNGGRERQGGRLRRRGTARRQRLPARSVPARRRQPADRRLWRQPRAIARGFRSRSPTR